MDERIIPKIEPYLVNNAALFGVIPGARNLKFERQLSRVHQRYTKYTFYQLSSSTCWIKFSLNFKRTDKSVWIQTDNFLHSGSPFEN